jgi:glycosyltransferase involved in cell wall biosynthesis
MKNKSIAIMLATYNGDKFIQLLLKSVDICAMNYPDTTVYIADDDSTDNTIEVIERLKLDLNIKILNTDDKAGSPVANFSRLISLIPCHHDLYFFCDQDDFWLPEKIAIFEESVNELNEKWFDIPILIHSDLALTDHNLSVTYSSMFKSQHIKQDQTFQEALIQSSVTGCASCINSNLLKLLKNSSIKKSIMHDWYASLMANVYGEVIFINKPTVLYRQHSCNQIGAKPHRLNEYISIYKLTEKYKQSIKDAYFSLNQAKLLLKDLEQGNLEVEKKELIRFITCFEGGWTSRLSLVGLKYGFYRKILCVIVLLFFPYFSRKGLIK